MRSCPRGDARELVADAVGVATDLPKNDESGGASSLRPWMFDERLGEPQLWREERSRDKGPRFSCAWATMAAGAQSFIADGGGERNGDTG